MLRKKLIALTISATVLLSNVGISSVLAVNPSVYNNEEVQKIARTTKVEELKAKSVLLMDIDSGALLFEKNIHEKFSMASITKIMSMMLVMEALDTGKITLEDKVAASDNTYQMEGSIVYLSPGEVFTVDEMLKAVAVHSANDATVALAEFLEGSEGVFVEKMNQKAKALEMKNTRFSDCTGLTDKGHFSSAYDIGIMARELILKHPKILEYTSIWNDTFRNGKFRLDNTNKLINFYNNATGLKTGYTSKAGYCLSASAKREDMNLIAIVLGEETTNLRFGEATKLLDYGFGNFEVINVIKKGEAAGNIEVDKGIEFIVATEVASDLDYMIKTDKKDKIKKGIKLKKGLVAPIKAGEKVGEMVLAIEEKELGRVDIVAKNDIEKASWFRLFIRAVAGWFGVKY